MSENTDFFDLGEIMIPKDLKNKSMDYADEVSKRGKRYNIVYYHYYNKTWKIGNDPWATKFVFKPVPSLNYFAAKQGIIFKSDRYKNLAATEDLVAYVKMFRIKVPEDPKIIKNNFSFRDAKMISILYTSLPAPEDVQQYADKSGIKLDTYDIAKLIKNISDLAYSDVRYSYLKALLPRVISFMPAIVIAKGTSSENLFEIAKSNLPRVYNSSLVNTDLVVVLRLSNTQTRDYNKFHYDENVNKTDYTSPLENCWLQYNDTVLEEMELYPIPQEKISDHIKDLIVTRFEMMNYINSLKDKLSSDFGKWIKLIEVYSYFIS